MRPFCISAGRRADANRMPAPSAEARTTGRPVASWFVVWACTTQGMNTRTARTASPMSSSGSGARRREAVKTYSRLAEAKNRGGGSVLDRRVRRTPARCVERRQGPSFRPPSQVLGPVCQAPCECLPRLSYPLTFAGDPVPAGTAASLICPYVFASLVAPYWPGPGTLTVTSSRFESFFLSSVHTAPFD